MSANSGSSDRTLACTARLSPGTLAARRSVYAPLDRRPGANDAARPISPRPTGSARYRGSNRSIRPASIRIQENITAATDRPKRARATIDTRALRFRGLRRDSTTTANENVRAAAAQTASPGSDAQLAASCSARPTTPRTTNKAITAAHGPRASERSTRRLCACHAVHPIPSLKGH